MFGFFKRKKNRRDQTDRDEQQQLEQQQLEQQSEQQETSPQVSDEPQTREEHPVTRDDTSQAPPASERERPQTPSIADEHDAENEHGVPETALDREEAETPRTSETPFEAEASPAAPSVVEPTPEEEAPQSFDEDRSESESPDVAVVPVPESLPEAFEETPPAAPQAPEPESDVEKVPHDSVGVDAPVEQMPVEKGIVEKTPAETPPVENEHREVASELTGTVRNRGRDKPRSGGATLGTEVGPETAETDDERAAAKKGWFSRMRQGLGKTRSNLTDGLATLLLGHKEIDDDLLEELETQLLMADVGVAATSEIMENLEAQISRRELKNVDALYKSLQQELSRMLEPVAKPLRLPPKGEGPFVILMVGVNGVGKTTTIGKLTQRFQRQGRSVMLAAGDTFRAAAVEQLQVWGERNNVPVIAQHTGADSASVIYDAVSAARARKIDVLIADTAGRLHNKGPLMEELRKVQRVMSRLDEHAPHEVMLVLDAGTGQNAIAQAQTFSEVAPVTGITLTKLDGTAKGGIIFAIAKQLGIPIRYIGVGETLDDLRPFEAEDFVGALFDRDDS